MKTISTLLVSLLIVISTSLISKPKTKIDRGEKVFYAAPFKISQDCGTKVKTPFQIYVYEEDFPEIIDTVQGYIYTECNEDVDLQIF